MPFSPCVNVTVSVRPPARIVSTAVRLRVSGLASAVTVSVAGPAPPLSGDTRHHSPGVAEAISALHVVLVVKVTDSDPPPVASVFSVPPESVSSGAGPSSCLSHPASHAAVRAKKSRRARYIKIVGLIRDCCVLLA